MDRLFNVKTSFKLMAECSLFSIDDQNHFKHVYQRLSMAANIDQKCSAFSDVCRQELRGVIQFGGILALVRVLRIIEHWQAIFTPILDEHHAFAGNSERLLQNFLWYTSSIAPVNVEFALLPPVKCTPFQDLPNWWSPIDQPLHQRYDRQCAFLVNAVNKALADSQTDLKVEALAALDAIAPNIQCGDRYIRHVRSQLFRLPFALSVKTQKLLADHMQYGNEISKVILDALLDDEELKNEICALLRGFSGGEVSDQVLHYLFECFVRADICSLLKHSFKDAGLSATESDIALPLRNKLCALSKSK